MNFIRNLWALMLIIPISERLLLSLISVMAILDLLTGHILMGVFGLTVTGVVVYFYHRDR